MCPGQCVVSCLGRCMSLYMPGAMCLLLYLRPHAPPCSPGHVSAPMSKAACPCVLPGPCVQSYMYHVSAHVSEPEHLLCTRDNESIWVRKVSTWSFLLYSLPSRRAGSSPGVSKGATPASNLNMVLGSQAAGKIGGCWGLCYALVCR